ncbi:hypothetical protein MTO96_019163 [Rhipicephalus appendiculatus]
MRTLRSSFLSSHPVAPSEGLRNGDDQTQHISSSISPCCRDCPGRAEGGSEGEVMAHNAANRAPQFGHQRPGLDATASRGGSAMGGPPSSRTSFHPVCALRMAGPRRARTGRYCRSLGAVMDRRKAGSPRPP